MSELIVNVLNSNVRTRKLDSGQSLILQKFSLEQKDDYPVIFEAVVDEPYRPGRYLFAPSFRNDRFGGLELNRYELNLSPLGK